MAELSKGAVVELTLPQRSQLAVTGGSVLAQVSNSKGGEIYSQSQVGGIRRVV